MNGLIAASGGLADTSSAIGSLEQCMCQAVSLDQRTRLIFILLSTHATALLQKITSHDPIIRYLELWWDDAVPGVPGMVRLLLKLLDHLPMTLDTLMKHKLAKKVSKASKTADDPLIQDLSRSLETKWRKLLESYTDPSLLPSEIPSVPNKANVATLANIPTTTTQVCIATVIIGSY